MIRHILLRSLFGFGILFGSMVIGCGGGGGGSSDVALVEEVPIETGDAESSDPGPEMELLTLDLAGGDLEAISLEGLPGLEMAQMIAAGNGHYLALIDGNVYGWGNNEYHQLGDGEMQVGSPQLLEGSGQVTQITAGDAHSIAVIADESGDTLLFWGEYLFDGEPMEFHPSSYVPVEWSVRAVESGRNHTLFLLENRDNPELTQLWTMGSNEFGQQGLEDPHPGAGPHLFPYTENLPEPVRLVAAGGDHSTLVLENEMIGAWGRNDTFQLARNTGGVPLFVPNLIHDPAESTFPVEIETVLGVVSGDGHTLVHVLTPAGEKVVVGWGSNRKGQLGLAKPGLYRNPILLASLGTDQVRTLVARGDYTAAILEEENGLLLLGADTLLAAGPSVTTFSLEPFATEVEFVELASMSPEIKGGLIFAPPAVTMTAFSSTKALALAGK